MERKEKHKKRHKHKAGHGKQERRKPITEKHKTTPQSRRVQEVFSIERTATSGNPNSVVPARR